MYDFFMRIFVLLILLLSFRLFAEDFTIHTVKQGETLYGISKQYKVSMDVIYAANPSLQQNALKIGTVLRIPTSNSSESKAITPSQQNIEKHVVIAKETLYSIAKKYEISVENIKQWNQLNSEVLKIGQELIVKKPQQKPIKPINNIEPTKVVVQPSIQTIEQPKKQDSNSTSNQLQQSKESAIVVKELSYAELFSEQQQEHKIIIKKATGAAMSTSDNNIDDTYFALHKSAKIGSLVKVRNMENNKTTYAKVIGRLPDIDENKKILIRLSLGARKQIKMGNDKCYLELQYIE